MSDFIPPLFKRFGKGFSDLIKEQFDFKKQIKVKDVASNGITVEATGEALKGGDYAGTLKGSYKHPDVGLFEGELNTLGTTTYSVKADRITKGLTVKASGDERPAAKLEIDYAQALYSTSLGVDVAQTSSNVDGALVAGYDGFAAGGSVKYDVTGQAVADYSFGAEYSHPDFTTTVKSTNQNTKASVAHLQKVNKDVSVGGQFTYDIQSGKNVFLAATSYNWDLYNASKVKVDTDMFLSTVLEHKLPSNNVKFLFSTEHNLRNSTTVPERFGLGLVFGDN